MKVDTQLIEWLLKNETQYKISKETGVAQATLSNILNGKRQMKNLTIEVGSILTEYAIEKQEEMKMEKEKYLELIKEELAEFDEEIRDGLYDVYYQASDNHIWLMESGMEYSGDDKEARYIAQIENQEVISWA